MSLKEDFKKALKDVGVIDTYDNNKSDFDRYGFQNIQNWPVLDFVKEDYENYQKHPEEYNYIESGLSFDDFIEATVGHNAYDPGDMEELDCENVYFMDFKVSDSSVVLEIEVGGDWQYPHLIKIIFENNKLLVENLGRSPRTTSAPDGFEKAFLKYIDIKED
jgi:hypothetical protein